MRENQVTHALCVSVTLEDFPQVLGLAERYPLAVVDPAQLCHDAAAVFLTLLHLDNAVSATKPQDPAAEGHDVAARLGVRLDLDPPLDAEHAADAAQGDPLLRRGAHCRSQGARARQAALAALARYCLSKSSTRSDG